MECDDQQHILQCKIILDEYKSDDLAITSATNDDIFSDDVLKKKEVTTLFLKLHTFPFLFIFWKWQTLFINILNF